MLSKRPKSLAKRRKSQWNVVHLSPAKKWREKIRITLKKYSRKGSCNLENWGVEKNLLNNRVTGIFQT